MKTIPTLFFSFLACLLFLSQTKDSITEIRKKCQRINQNIQTYNKKEKKDNTKSTDGGIIKGYYKNKQLQLISAEYFGESGKIKTDYYFNNGMLIQAVKTEFNYNRPYYYNEKMARENKDTVWHDDKKTINNTNTFYFVNSQLVLWIKDNNQQERRDRTVFTQQQSDILLDTKRLIALLN